jgi:hypothetical protein
MMILEYNQAVEDCDKALAIDPFFVKAYFRRGKALAAMVGPPRSSGDVLPRCLHTNKTHVGTIGAL